jgi:hypothetical protein
MSAASIQPSTPSPRLRQRRTVRTLIRSKRRALGGWALLIGASLIGVRLSAGTSFHQLAIGILMSSITLFVSMAVFESLWLAFFLRNS